MNNLPRSCWVVLDHRHEPDRLAEHAAWYHLVDAELEARFIRKQCLLPKDSVAIEVVEITLQ